MTAPGLPPARVSDLKGQQTVKKLFAVIVALMLVVPAFAIEGEQVRMSYSFLLPTVASATTNSIYAFTAPCDIRLRGVEVYSVANAAIGDATSTVTFTVYDDSVAIQSYNLADGALTAGTPKAFTLTAAKTVIAKDSVIKCSAVVASDSRAVTTPVVTIHYTPTK
jgi:hypothetical protein